MTATAARRLATPSSVNAAIKQIADVMRRANYAGALQYVPELSWILFLRILDEREEIEAEEAAALGIAFAPSLEAPFRWRDWAAPGGAKRVELTDAAMGGYLAFVNGGLLPHLRGLREAPGASARQRVISQVVSAIDKVAVDTEKNPRRLLVRWRRREDEPALLHEGRSDGAYLVLRPLGREGHEEPAADDRSLRGAVRAGRLPGGFAALLDGHPRGAGGAGLRPQGGEPDGEGQWRSDTRTPLELLDEIETRGREVDAALARLRALLATQ